MKRVTFVKLFVNDQDEALEFYTRAWGSKLPRTPGWVTTAGCSSGTIGPELIEGLAMPRYICETCGTQYTE
jgi:hypothetical protein